MTSARSCIVRDSGSERRSEFVRRGHKGRFFFPHRVLRLPKAGPDGYKLAERMCGPVGTGQLWELVLYGLAPVVDEFPAELFVDDDIVWHQQHFGLPGQVATVNLVERRPELYAMVLISDVVQRIGRRRAFKTRIENRFAGWNRLLIHACLDFALDRGLDRLNVATADWAIEHTDRSRTVDRSLFDRVYDHGVGTPFLASRDGRWWVLDVKANAPVLVRPEVSAIPLGDEPTICVSHDIERGWGHRDIDPHFASTAERDAPRHLERMLALEAGAEVRATYSVLGALMDEVRPVVEAGGHCLAFHSYDHAAFSGGEGAQLSRCRDVDYRIKGYRPPQSKLSAELTSENLLFHNFEWLASSRHSLQLDVPTLRDAIVHIPILFDDFGLHQGEDYEGWLETGLHEVASSDCAVLSLHDCYGEHWLGGYPDLLRMLGDLGRLRTLDEVAAECVLRNAV